MFLNVILFNPYVFKPQKKMKSNISCSYIELYVNLAVVVFFATVWNYVGYLSPKAFNDTTGFVSVCPITHTVRGWGFEVSLPDNLVVNGVLTDQIKNLDWRAQHIDIVGSAFFVMASIGFDMSCGYPFQPQVAAP